MATRTVTGKVLRPNGAGWPGAKVKFRPVDDSYLLSPDESYPIRVETVTTDADGEFSVALAAGLTVAYEVTMPDEETFQVIVSDGAATTLELLRAAYDASTPEPLPSLEVVVGEIIEDLGIVDTANAPNANEFARFTDANTLEGRTTSETRTDLGLVIGTNVQAWSANLDEYSAVNPTAAGLALLDDANAAAQLITLGVTSTAAELNYTDGVTSAIQTQLDGKQPLDADLTTIAGLTPTTNNFLVANASAWASRTPTQAIAHLGLDADIATLSLPASTTITTFGASLVDDANAAAAIATLGLDADIATLALPASTTISAFGATLVDDAAASNARTTLGLGTIATQDANNVAISGGSVAGITDITLADGGTGASLVDPNADRIMFWDDSAGAVTWLTAGTNLTITGTTIDASGGGGGGSPGGSDTQVQFNDGGSFGGDAGITYNKTTDKLTMQGELAIKPAAAQSKITLDTTGAGAYEANLWMADNGSNKWAFGKGTSNDFFLYNSTTGNDPIDVLGASDTVKIFGPLIYNDAGGDKDARFEGDTDANLLFLDASTDRIGVGKNNPAVKLDVNGVIDADSVTVDDLAYDATTWNGSVAVPTRNAVRDKIESLTGGTPGGSNTQVQFNDSSAFGGDAGLTYNKTTDALTVAGALTAASLNLGGATMLDVLSATTTWNPASVSTGGANVQTTVTVTGAAVGDPCFCGLTTLTTQTLHLYSSVSAANTVTVTLGTYDAGGSGDLGSGTLRCVVLKF